MKFRDAIRQANSSLEHIPSGYKRYGTTMVLRSSHQLSQELGEAILSVYSWCKTVYQHETTSGQSRIPELRLLAGEDNPEVRHRENGVDYLIDISRITFSGGNRYLRERLVEIVEEGEYLLDMFAAVGNLSLQPLVHREIEALLIERNPYTFSYLEKNLQLNGLDQSMAKNMDCRSLDRQNFANRIFMGYHEVDKTHLTIAIHAATEDATIHLHPIVPKDDWEEAINKYNTLFDQLSVTYSNPQIYAVKDFAPGLEHLEMIYEIHK